MIDIQPTKSSPRVVYSDQEKTLTLSGESYPENSFDFFKPIFEWLHTELPKLDELRFRVDISYMNSSSTKCMLDMLDILGDTARHNCRVSVFWYYDRENARALELAEEFKEDVEVPFEIVPLDNRDPEQ